MMKCVTTSLLVLGIALPLSPLTESRAQDAKRVWADSGGPVRIVFRKDAPKIKGKLATTLDEEALTFQRAQESILAIPLSKIHVVFYDRLLLKKFLKEATEPEGPGLRRRQFGVYDGASVALAVYGVGTAGTYAALMAPALAFPPALIAVGGIAALAAVKKGNKRHYVHIIWEDNDTTQAIALTLQGQGVENFLATLEQATRSKYLNLPEERKMLARAKARSRSLTILGPSNFGNVALKEGQYQMVLVEGEPRLGELNFFKGNSVNRSKAAAVAPVQIQRDDEGPLKGGVLVTRAPDSTSRIEEIGILGKRLRPAYKGDVG